MTTPCYIIDNTELEASLKGFKDALDNYLDNYILSYSVKTNSLPFLLKTANKDGYYAEVVSDDEYQLAIKCGFRKNQIVYNGPSKSKDTFLDAIKNKSIVNIETFHEIEWLSDLDNETNYQVGLRMNINISKVSPEDENHPEDDSRFGFSCESGDFDSAVKAISQLKNIKITRIHIHRTSRTRSVSFYERTLDYAINQFTIRNLPIEQIDIGGGYFGIMPNKPTFKEYALAISSVLKKHNLSNRLGIIIEPGNAIVASCFDFITSVIDVKNHDGARYVTIDGSRIDIDPFFHKDNYFMDIELSQKNKVVPKQIIGGCTCLESDRLTILYNRPALSIGDKIRFRRVGAYTMTLTPLFIRYWPCIYLNNGKDYILVRDKWDANKLL